MNMTNCFLGKLGRWLGAPKRQEAMQNSLRVSDNKGNDVSTAVSPLVRAEWYIYSRYKVRLNVLTNQPEMCRRRMAKQDGMPMPENDWAPVTRQDRNQLLMELAEQNIGVMTLAALDAVINNRSIEKFHPVHDWIASLPEWDGTCRVEALMTRLTDNDYERRLLVRAFTAMVVQMAGIRQNGYGNSLCPILISTRHGWGKSQFIKRLLPETLRPYFTDSFNPAEEDQCLRRMATRALICLDEFDRFVGKRLTTLKNFIQMSSVDLKQLYQGRYEVKERLASFWGTSNRRYVLMDETGSRRYLPVVVSRPIGNEELDYGQLYAEALAAYRSNPDMVWLTDEENAELEAHNRPYCALLTLKDLFNIHFEVLPGAKASDEGLLTAADVYNHLVGVNPDLLSRFSEGRFGEVLRSLGAVQLRNNKVRLYNIRFIEEV
jgi:Predicted P-loop ATPase and inactivated derivatives